MQLLNGPVIAANRLHDAMYYHGCMSLTSTFGSDVAFVTEL